jgi:hypothetical protein
MEGVNRPAAAVLLLSLLGLLAPPPAPARADDGPVSVDWVADDAVCRCRAGNACWHYLRAPSDPPADACWCNYCVKVSRHDGTRAMPEDFSEVCASNGKPTCFLKRHAASWSFLCSECIQPKKCCNNPRHDDCPKCERGGSPWDPEKVREFQFRVRKEQEVFANRDVVLVWSPHFYVATDIPSLKIPTSGGSYRVATTHELAHIYAERAEKARREFVQCFSDEVGMTKPSAIFLPKREQTAEKIQGQYNSSPRTNLVYGGSNDGNIANGFCFNGFCASLQKHGGDDKGLHHVVRHMIGHLMISCWTKVEPKDRALPRWMFEGVAHWLAKRHPLLEDEVVWCADEGKAIGGSGKDWDDEARKVAGDLKTVPVERLLEKSTIGLMDYDDHVRAWSYFDLGLREDREPFLKVLRNLRDEVATRQAWVQAMACTPEQWDQRWKDRLLGRRPTFAALPTDRDDEGPGAAERRALRNEQDVQNLVARIRAIGTCADPRTAAVLTELFARDSEPVREVLSVVLSRTAEPKALAAIREKGLGHPHPMVRAYSARVLGLAGDQGSLEGLRALVADGFWLARAEAALGLMRLKDPKLPTSLRPMLADPSAKARIAALDAVSTAGSAAERCLSAVADNLDHSSWQVRSAAAECLGGIGSMAGVDPLLARMTNEAGRIRKDCHEALKRVTKDDLGLNPENWAKWWKREREKAGGGLPEAPKAPGAGAPDPSLDEQRYGITPRSYGMRVFSERVCYVLDMSNSMFNSFEPDPSEVRKLRRKYTGSNKFDISREEIVQSVQGLNPETRFNVMVFADRPRLMSNSLVPASPDNHRKAESFLKSCRSTPASGAGSPLMTSFYDAFRSVFDLPKGVSAPPANFTDTPDTFFFLTDGAPTTGDIVDADELLAWFNGLNRYARIRVHVVAYGNMGIDLPFLTHLAEDNGGQLIHVREAPNAAKPDLPGNTPK